MREIQIDTATLKLMQELYEVLDLIDFEFRTDPISTQCFDSRVIKRARKAIIQYQKEGRHLA